MVNMTNTTYIRAAASIIPFIGPTIALFNLRSGNKEICKTRKEYDLAHVVELRVADQPRDDKDWAERYISAYKKARLYAVAGFIGNIVTLICRVRLYTSGVVPFIGMIPIVSVGLAVFFGYRFYHYHNKLKHCEHLRGVAQERLAQQCPV